MNYGLKPLLTLLVVLFLAGCSLPAIGSTPNNPRIIGIEASPSNFPTIPAGEESYVGVSIISSRGSSGAACQSLRPTTDSSGRFSGSLPRALRKAVIGSKYTAEQISAPKNWTVEYTTAENHCQWTERQLSDGYHTVLFSYDVIIVKVIPPVETLPGKYSVSLDVQHNVAKNDARNINVVFDVNVN